MLVLTPEKRESIEMTTLSVRLPLETYEQLVRECEKYNIKVSSAIRQLINQLLEARK
jgi:antitoxin component of RelBE/YafQ-DinJ toxin-antitoxin module